MKGIEFQIVHEKAPVLWVIRKQNRLSEWSGMVNILYLIKLIK